MTTLFAPSIAGSNGGNRGTAFQKVTGAVIAGLVGGTASKIGGGKFANGARTALVQYLFNQVREGLRKEKPLSRAEVAALKREIAAELEFSELVLDNFQDNPGIANYYEGVSEFGTTADHLLMESLEPEMLLLWTPSKVQ